MNAPTDPEVLQRAERQAQVVAALQKVLPHGCLLWHAEETTPYECDGLTAYRQRPLVVALPETEQQVQDVPGYALLSIVIGSEGMLAVAIEVTVKLVPKPQLARCIMASFDDVRKAGDAVAAVIAAGIIPAGLEMMDKPMTAAVEDFVHAGYDLAAEAILLCESDGTPEEVEEEIGRMVEVLRVAGATALAVSRNEAERLKFWSGRKNAFPASGRISPDYMCMDSTIPRKRLADILLAIQEMEKKYALRCANVFHAGDGNLHPLILFDANDANQLLRAELFGAD